MLKLCEKCAEKTQERIDNTVIHNPDKSIEWWNQWGDKELERQKKVILSHCAKAVRRS